jgi:hypothetical protein
VKVVKSHRIVQFLLSSSVLATLATAADPIDCAAMDRTCSIRSLPDELPPIKPRADSTPSEIRGEGSNPGTVNYSMWLQDCLALGNCTSFGTSCKPYTATQPCKCQ